MTPDKAFFANVAPESDPARALERAIKTNAKDISHRVLKRQEDRTLFKHQYAKTVIRRNLNELVGMVQAYQVIVGLPLPPETLAEFSRARRLVEKVW